MKRKTLSLEKLKVQSFTTTQKVKGGFGEYTFDVEECGESNNAMCTFDDCLSQGPGCSRYQVC
ncbi:hypothetical protein AB9P05_02595 [Roseivirga sp. BDSF3-8]|uniref:hypothetical protein n=1 Tax=Roseivirga sp. BDSF3-8 TaxID=3241598 RepID=UPI003531D545